MRSPSHVTARRISADARSQLHAFLAALGEAALPGSYFEVRERHGQCMRRRFHPVEFPDQAVSAILRAGRERDVYVGAAPRASRCGGRDGIALLGTLWVDADTPDALTRLQAFSPAPSIVVASGRGRHAYWLLDHPVDLDAGEAMNRRLARHLAADERCFDAARILRPPCTVNYGYRPPRPVDLVHLAPEARHELASISALLPPLEPRKPQRPRAAEARMNDGARSGDRLLDLEPAVYVARLLDVSIGRDRKVPCPFHSDEHPSLHVYPTAEQGWHCFSCGRGGSVYDLAAALWDVQPRGMQFLKLRAELELFLLGR